MQAQDVMHWSVARFMNTDVPTCSPGDRAEQVRHWLAASKSPVAVVVVGDCKRVVGVIARQELENAPDGARADGLMHPPNLKCHPEDTLEWARVALGRSAEGYLTVVTWTDDLLGIVMRDRLLG